MAKEIFISYSRKDFEKVKAIKNEIDSELGIKCWMDLDGIESGEQFENKIITAIKDHDTMLFMLSTRSMNSIYALKELKFAQLKKKRVVLVYIESCEMSDEFLFNYSMYDTIEWSNPLQHDKLLRNLRQWFGGTQQPKPTTNEPTDPEEQYKLAQRYHYGFGNTPKNVKEAIKWYRLAAEQGHAEAQYQMGEYYSLKDNWVEANKWYQMAAEQGDPRAQYQLGFYNDEILEAYGAPNYAEALKWYKKSAEQGYEYAQTALGRLFLNGKGVPKDFDEAVRWYAKAAKQGWKPAKEWQKEHKITPYQ